jgi:hypothetical protein
LESKRAHTLGYKDYTQGNPRRRIRGWKVDGRIFSVTRIRNKDTVEDDGSLERKQCLEGSRGVVEITINRRGIPRGIRNIVDE